MHSLILLRGIGQIVYWASDRMEYIIIPICFSQHWSGCVSSRENNERAWRAATQLGNVPSAWSSMVCKTVYYIAYLTVSRIPLKFGIGGRVLALIESTGRRASINLVWLKWELVVCLALKRHCRWLVIFCLSESPRRIFSFLWRVFSLVCGRVLKFGQIRDILLTRRCAYA